MRISPSLRPLCLAFTLHWVRLGCRWIGMGGVAVALTNAPLSSTQWQGTPRPSRARAYTRIRQWRRVLAIHSEYPIYLTGRQLTGIPSSFPFPPSLPSSSSLPLHPASPLLSTSSLLCAIPLPIPPHRRSCSSPPSASATGPMSASIPTRKRPLSAACPFRLRVPRRPVPSPPSPCRCSYLTQGAPGGRGAGRALRILQSCTAAAVDTCIRAGPPSRACVCLRVSASVHVRVRVFVRTQPQTKNEVRGSEAPPARRVRSGVGNGTWERGVRSLRSPSWSGVWLELRWGGSRRVVVVGSGRRRCPSSARVVSRLVFARGIPRVLICSP